MLRIEKNDKTLIIGDGLDVQITDTTITIKPIAFVGGGQYGSAVFDVFGQATGRSAQDIQNNHAQMGQLANGTGRQ